jgi:hypothetical protein
MSREADDHRIRQQSGKMIVCPSRGTTRPQINPEHPTLAREMRDQARADLELERSRARGGFGFRREGRYETLAIARYF